jgi:NAD(P)-dependent dehydrogenase (short-subunit alcohol dehydrogenase family)
MGKKALVTGCSRGIGAAMAIGLAEAGADIIGVSNSLKPGSDVEEQVKAAAEIFGVLCRPGQPRSGLSLYRRSKERARCY